MSGDFGLENMDPSIDRALSRGSALWVWPLMTVSGIVVLAIRMSSALADFARESVFVFRWVARRRRTYRALMRDSGRAR